MVELADALALHRFAIMGVSGGGPYAAVCALKIPQRLHAAGITSGMGPVEAPGTVADMRPLNQQLVRIGRTVPWLVRPLSWQVVRALRRDPDRFFAELLADLPDLDQTVLAQAEISDHLLKVSLEAFRNGSRGAAIENALYARSWGIRPADLHSEVHLWHGELDTNAPPAMGHYLAAAVPNCRSRFYANEGHISLLINHMDEILPALRS